jgi:RNA polymerase sigma factor for flagellar operon FliA
LALFDSYMPFARTLAAKVRRDRHGADLDPNELIQLAAEGLLQAIDRYDPDRGGRFETFAARRITGNVIDGIAASSERRRQISTRNRIHSERARSLTPQDAAALPVDDALRALADLATELALGIMLEEATQGPVTAFESPYESLVWSQTASRISQAIEALPEKERVVVRLHYLEGLEFARIADTLRLTRGRVSQIHAAALKRLRLRLPALRPS